MQESGFAQPRNPIVLVDCGYVKRAAKQTKQKSSEHYNVYIGFT
jgi:hypothetical protein